MRHGFSRPIIRALVLCAAAGLSACGQSDDNKAETTPSNVTLTDAQQKNIHLVTVTPSKFHKSIETNGIVDFDNDQATVVIAPFSGPVTQLLVKLGQSVKKGEALATVDSSDYAAAIDAYRKAIVTAATDRKLADMDKDLLAHQSVSAREAAQAETDASSAEADREAARQALVALNVDPKIIAAAQNGRAISHIVAGVIRAPISGTIADRPISPGQLLQAGATPCFTIADLSRMWVQAQIFGADLNTIGVGDKAEVMTGQVNVNITGHVENVGALVDPNTRAVSARVVLDNPSGLLKKQMYVSVLIEDHRESTGFLVPTAAILRDDENLPFVYARQRDGSFAREHVTLGYRDGDRYEVTGVHAGDLIVADGALFLEFMQNQ